jgi:hypothetical protein
MSDDKLNVQIEQLKTITNYWSEIGKSVVDVTKSFGQSNHYLSKTGSYSSVLYNNLGKSAERLENMGVSAKEIVTFISQMVSETGTMVGMSDDAMIQYGALSELLGKTNVDGLVKGFISVGRNVTTSMKLIKDIEKSSVQMGLDATAVSKVMADNFKTASSYSFKGGSKGIGDMARQSLILGQNMSETLQIAKKLRKPEQAIEFAQQMQSIGGAFADLLGDATTNLYEARNEPDKFAARMSKASASLITFNEQTGELEANFDAAQQAADVLGKDVDQIIEEGKKAKKLEVLKNSFQGLTDDQLNVLTGFADFKGGKISLDGLDEKTMGKLNLSQDKLSDISKLTSEEMGNLVETLKKGYDDKDKKDGSVKQSAEEQVLATKSLTESMTNLKNSMQASSQTFDLVKTTISGPNGLVNSIQSLMKSGSGGSNVIKDLSSVTTGFAELLIDEITKNILKIPKLLDKQMNTPSGGNTSTTTTPSNFCSGKGLTDCPSSDVGDTTKCTKYGNTWCSKKKEKGGILKTGSIITKKEHFGNGGVFKGPSHEDGGIPVLNKTTGKMLEVEGGEAIINKNSTEMFKPILSKINEVGGGVKFAEGGITPVDLENIMSKMGNSVNTSINTNSSMDVNVNINGIVSIDGKDFKIPEDQKEKLSKSIINKAIEEVNNKINNNVVTLGKRNKPVYPLDTN